MMHEPPNFARLGGMIFFRPRPEPAGSEPAGSVADGPPPFRVRQWVADVAALVLVIGPGFTALPGLGGTILSNPAAVLVTLILMAAVLARSRLPRTAAAVAIAAVFAGTAAEGPIVSLMVGVLVCVFSVGSRTDRRTTMAFGVLGAVVAAGAALLFITGPQGDVRAVLQIMAFVGFAAAAGDASRSGRAHIAAITERARRAEETKEAEARRRVAEERVSIARDLHDVLAHQIAVINLHASVASQALRDRPDDAERSLATIREAARTVLGEISGLLTVLRADGPETPAPTPGLENLHTLIAAFRAGGLDVDVRTVGEVRELDGATDVVAYRVVQEALTNAQKHGNDGTALLHIEYLPAEVAITVTNATDPTRSGPQGGHGLLGVQERVRAIRGRLETQDGPGPVFRFTVWLPAAERVTL